MIREALHKPRLPHFRRRVQPRSENERRPNDPPSAYGRPFWLTYVANFLFAMAIALLFRYADFVTLLGGTEFHLGWIVGAGMVGSLCMRLALGSCIDRYGARVVWLGSALLMAAACFAHLAVASHTGVPIYLLRVLFCSAVAGIGGASMAFVSVRAPDERVAELVGMLGTSGFMGIVTGTVLGDLMLGSVTVGRQQVSQMFIAAGLLALLCLPFAWLATRGEARSMPQAGPSLLRVLRRYHPGAVLVIGVAMGMALGMPGVFLRTYAAQLDIPRIGMFFLVYAAAAIVTRILTRRWSERFGARRVILLGMAGMAASMALFLPVHAEWQLALPAIGFGCCHAILFPAVVAVGSVAFPVRHRGLATVLVLAAWDTGQLIGAPSIGAILRYSEMAGLPPYPTMFLAIAGLLALVGVWYAAASRGGVAPKSR